jgi:hypothetical protein
MLDACPCLRQVYAYINGVQQASTLDISGVPGSIDNGEPFTLGTLYGWHTDGTLDEYRLYNRAVTPAEVATLYQMVRPAEPVRDCAATVTWPATLSCDGGWAGTANGRNMCLSDASLFCVCLLRCIIRNVARCALWCVRQ